MYLARNKLMWSIWIYIFLDILKSKESNYILTRYHFCWCAGHTQVPKEVVFRHVANRVRRHEGRRPSTICWPTKPWSGCKAAATTGPTKCSCKYRVSKYDAHKCNKHFSVWMTMHSIKRTAHVLNKNVSITCISLVITYFPNQTREHNHFLFLYTCSPSRFSYPIFYYCLRLKESVVFHPLFPHYRLCNAGVPYLNLLGTFMVIL